MFLYYARCVSDINVKLHLYDMALYHLWELDQEIQRPGIVQHLGVTKALLGLWTQIIHMEYQMIHIDAMMRQGRNPTERCSCAICAPPRAPLYQPRQFWEIWKNLFVDGCACNLCAYRRNFTVQAA